MVQIPAEICSIADDHEPVTCPQTLRGTLPAICATPSTETPIAAALTAAMNSRRLSRARCRSSFNSFVRILLCSRNFLYHFGCLPQRAGRGGRVRNVQPSLRSVGHIQNQKGAAPTALGIIIHRCPSPNPGWADVWRAGPPGLGSGWVLF